MLMNYRLRCYLKVDLIPKMTRAMMTRWKSRVLLTKPQTQDPVLRGVKRGQSLKCQESPRQATVSGVDGVDAVENVSRGGLKSAGHMRVTFVAVTSFEKLRIVTRKEVSVRNGFTLKSPS